MLVRCRHGVHTLHESRIVQLDDELVLDVRRRGQAWEERVDGRE
jgi:hypothetical protein